MKVLGLDIGNAKIKPCLIDFNTSLEESRIAWQSFPLPFTENRQQDFTHGIPFNMQLFLNLHPLTLKDLDCVVVCSSHSYSYPEFHHSISHLATILQSYFADVPVYFVSVNGDLTPVGEILALPEQRLYAYVLTNFYGSAYLGSKLIRNGVSIDIGTTTTDIIPICQGRIDPVGLSDPENYLSFRYQHHRIHWLGITATPLCALTDRVEIGNRQYQVVPRDYCTDLIFALLQGQDAELLGKHAYFQDFPQQEQARIRLAQFVGLDPCLLPPGKIDKLAHTLYQLMVGKVAEAIRKVVQETLSQSLDQLEVAVFALGERLLAIPALQRAGFEEKQIRYLELKRDQDLWSASSAFAMALKGLESLLGTPLPLEPGEP